MAPQNPPSTMISLPSIHEMFPEHLTKTPIQHDPNFRNRVRAAHSHKVSSDDFYLRSPSSQPLDKNDRPSHVHRGGFMSDPATTHPGTHPQIHLSTSQINFPKSSLYSAPPPAPSSWSAPTSADTQLHSPLTPTSSTSSPSASVSVHRINGSQDSVNAPTYSFGVFRSDPATSSLEHITSSTTLRNHTATSQRGQSTGIADGSVPAFTVVVSEPVPPQAAVAPRRISAAADERQRDNSGYASSAFSVLPLPTAASCSSFPVSDYPARQSHDTQGEFKTFSKDAGFSGRTMRYNPGDILKGKVHEKLHECRHCLKRFNRPSSLRIHANTHTGARPFQCPFPDCGREFNVNSNMRRHYRNHTRAGFLESQGASSKDIRVRKVSGATSPGSQPSLSPSDRGTHQQLPSPSTNSTRSSEYSDGEMMFEMDNCDQFTEEDDLDEPTPEVEGYHRDEKDTEDEDAPCTRFPSTARPPCFPPKPPQNDHGHTSSRPERQYPQPRAHTLPRSPSHSPCPSGPAKQAPGRAYASSSPVYARSCTDSKVSTVLRPAFEPASLARAGCGPLGRTKQEER